MTFATLTDSVARLGFERGLDDTGVLIPALRRALYTLFTDRPEEQTARVVCPPFRGRLLFSHMEHTPGSTERFALPGAAFSMILSGRGQYTVSHGGATELKEFDSPRLEVRSLLYSDAEIEFSGPYAFSVLTLTVYPTVRSDRAQDVPLYDRRTELPILELIPDLLSLSRAPIAQGGRAIEGAELRGGSLSLPDGFSGELTVYYNRAPRMPGGLDPDEEIDAPPEAAELLPLLVAFYVWLEDSPEIAQYYLSLYRDGIRTLAQTMPGRGAEKYTTDGWA